MGFDWGATKIAGLWSRRKTFEDREVLIHAVRRERTEGMCRSDANFWLTAELLGLVDRVGLDCPKQWLAQNVRRGLVESVEVGDETVFTDEQVASVISRLLAQRRFLPGRMLWARTPDELEAEADEHSTPFLAIVAHLSDVCDEQELDRRYAVAAAEAATWADSDDSGAEARYAAAKLAMTRYKVAAAARRGEIDLNDFVRVSGSTETVSPLGG